jgi:hypothetical protein
MEADLVTMTVGKNNSEEKLTFMSEVHISVH